MRVTYITRSFLDYRIPVFKALQDKLGQEFCVIYSADYVPERVHRKAVKVLGERAVGLRGEKRLGPNEITGYANSAVRIVYQPGIMGEIRKTKPNLLIGDGFFQWTGFALIYRLIFGNPLVLCYERTHHTERNAQGFRTAYRRAVLRFVDAMCVNGQQSKDYTKWLGMTESRITTGHMAADTENLVRLAANSTAGQRSRMRGKWGRPELVFLYVGRLIKLKGMRELLKSWAVFEKNVPFGCALAMVGSGPEEIALRKLVGDLGIEKAFFIGKIDYAEMVDYYRAADVLVMPTLEDNWSLVVPEAMACGLPVICSKYNGCYPEMIATDQNGWVFDPLSREDTFEALKKCVENKHRLEQMGEKSREIVSRHTPQHAAQAIFDACTIAMESNRRKKHVHSYRTQ